MYVGSILRKCRKEVQLRASEAGICGLQTGNDGHWYDVGKFKSTPALPETDIVFFQPPFAQYVLEFPAVETKGIRVLMDAKVQEHWHKYTKNVSSFISITELGVYEK